MKKKILLLPLLALVCACTGNQTSNQTGEDSTTVDSVKEVTLDTISLHLHKNLIEGKDAPSYDIVYKLLAAKGDDDLSRLFNEELSRGLFDKAGMQVDSAMRFQADSIAASYTADLKEFYQPDNEYDFAFKYTYEVNADVKDDSYPGIAAYTTELFTYTGGAHGGYLLTGLNLNRRTGHAILRDDFFQKDKLPDVKHLVEKSLMEHNGCSTMSQLVERTGICSLGEVYVSNNNFLLLQDSVEFIFNPYELASWANGLITTRVAYSDLAPCIKQDVLPKK